MPLPHPIDVKAGADAIGRALEYLQPGSGAQLMHIDGILHLTAWPDGVAIPTDSEIAQAISDYRAAEEQEQEDRIALRQQIRQRAQAAVGVSYDQVTAGMIKALVWILLWRIGALNPDLTLKPLAQWVRDA